jgi:hypothetical protein
MCYVSLAQRRGRYGGQALSPPSSCRYLEFPINGEGILQSQNFKKKCIPGKKLQVFFNNRLCQIQGKRRYRTLSVYSRYSSRSCLSNASSPPIRAMRSRVRVRPARIPLIEPGNSGGSDNPQDGRYKKRGAYPSFLSTAARFTKNNRVSTSRKPADCASESLYRNSFPETMTGGSEMKSRPPGTSRLDIS